MANRISELFGIPVQMPQQDWQSITRNSECPFLKKTCEKTRKSMPEISMGTCSVILGVKAEEPTIICPHRFLENQQIFTDCIHLLEMHAPGNQLHVVTEIAVPGGSVDYILASVHRGEVIDFVGIELQALDTTGSVWYLREMFLKLQGVPVQDSTKKVAGINWKMTAKTTLIQLHHKAQTFEKLNKRLVLVIQHSLLAYLEREFVFDHLQDASSEDPVHFHPYQLINDENSYSLQLTKRFSTNVEGIARCLGLRTEQNLEFQEIANRIGSRLSTKTLLTIGGSI